MYITPQKGLKSIGLCHLNFKNLKFLSGLTVVCQPFSDHLAQTSEGREQCMTQMIRATLEPYRSTLHHPNP